MTHHLRFRPVTGGPDEAYRNFDGAGFVSLAFALTDWWVQWRDQMRSTAETSRRARAASFSLTLLAALDCGTAVSADAPAGLVCGGDYVCVAELPCRYRRPASTATASKPPSRSRLLHPRIEISPVRPPRMRSGCSAAAVSLRAGRSISKSCRKSGIRWAAPFLGFSTPSGSAFLSRRRQTLRR